MTQQKTKSLAVIAAGCFSALSATSANAANVLIDEDFETGPGFTAVGNGNNAISATTDTWLINNPTHMFWGDIDGETANDTENGMLYSVENFRTFVYIIDLGESQTTYGLGDEFTATVNIGANVTSLTAGLGVFTTDNGSLTFDLANNDVVAPTLTTLIGSETSAIAFYETGALTLSATPGVTSSGLRPRLAAPGSEAVKADINGTLTVNGTFSAAHRYIGIALMAQSTSADDWIGFDNASLVAVVVPEPSSSARVT